MEIFKYAEQDSSFAYFIYIEKELDDFISYLINKGRSNNLFLIIGKTEEKECFNWANELKSFIDYETIIRNKKNIFFQENRKKYSKNEYLIKKNIENKLITDLKIIFKSNESLDLKESFNALKLEISDNDKQELVNYFIKIMNILNITKENNKYYLLIENIFKKNLDNLIENILSKHIYDLSFSKIMKNIIDGFNNELLEILKKYNTS